MGFIEYYFGKDGIGDKLALTNVESFIKDMNPEGMTLEYKEPSRIGSDDDGLAETIASFLNTNGGLLLYGVSVKHEPKGAKGITDKQYPEKIVPCDAELTKERLQQILYHKVEPWNSAIKIIEIVDEGGSGLHIFAIDVPQSNEAPHMGVQKFLSRTEAGNMPMTYRQVSTAFLANRAEKSELINHVYAWLYKELDDFISRPKYEYGSVTEFDKILQTYRHLWILVRIELRNDAEKFYRQLRSFNYSLGMFHNNINRIVREAAVDELGLPDKEQSAEVYVLAYREGEEQSFYRMALFSFLARAEDPIEAVKKSLPDEIIAKVILEVDYAGTRTPLPLTHSGHLYYRCRDAVEKLPSAIAVRETEEELRKQAAKLRGEYFQLLTY